MKILPVLDLMQGQIVRGVAGQRADYRPLESRLVDSAEPLAVARALHAAFGFEEFYLADLDAIAGRVPDLPIYQQLQDAGFRLMLDAGVRTHADRTLKMLIVANVARIVVGLETLRSPEHLRHILARLGTQRVVFSLDLKSGQPLGPVETWRTADPFAIAEQAIGKLGARQMIVLDLAHVGVGGGIGTEELCGRLRQAFPELTLIAGGGVASGADLRRLNAIGIDQMLIASALHDGRITPEEVVQMAHRER